MRFFLSLLLGASLCACESTVVDGAAGGTDAGGGASTSTSAADGGGAVSAGGGDASVASSSSSGGSPPTSSSCPSGSGGEGPLWCIVSSGPTEGYETTSLAIAPSGNLLFAAGYSGGAMDFAGQLPCTAMDGSGLIAAVSPTGQLLWSRCIEPTAMYSHLAVPYSIASDSHGNVLVAGAFRGTVDFGDGNPVQSERQVGFFAVYDASGSLLFVQALGLRSQTYGAAFDSAGNIVLSGLYTGSTSFGTTVLTTASPQGQAIFVAKFDPSGAPLWAKGLGEGDTASYCASRVATDAAGAIGLVTCITDPIDFGAGPLTENAISAIAAVFEPDGTLRWGARAVGQFSQAEGVAFDSGGNLIAVGSSNGPLDFGGGPLPKDGPFYVKFAPSGAILAQAAFGGRNAAFLAVSVDADDNAIIAGDTQGPITIGQTTHDCSQARCALAAKFDPNGVPITSWLFKGKAGWHAYTGASAAVAASGELVFGGFDSGPVDFGAGPVGSAKKSVFLVALPSNP